MNDLQKLKALEKFGENFRDNPLATYSDDSLAKELKKRGWMVMEPINIDLDFSELDLTLLPDLTGG